MTFTLADLRNSIRHTLTDATVFRDALITEFMRDGLREYSGNFAWQTSQKFDCEEGVREYDLVAKIGYVMAILSVEYPAGQDPKRYLFAYDERGSLFASNPAYDVRGDPPKTLVLSVSPSAEEEIKVVYSTMHAYPANESTGLTVPDEHMEILRLYVIYRAMVALETDQNIDVSRRYQLANALGLSTQRAWRLYQSKVSEARRNQATASWLSRWKQDKNDRVY